MSIALSFCKLTWFTDLVTVLSRFHLPSPSDIHAELKGLVDKPALTISPSLKSLRRMAERFPGGKGLLSAFLVCIQSRRVLTAPAVQSAGIFP